MIYIIREKRGQDYPPTFKIGYTRDRPENRMKELITGNPTAFEVLHIFEGDEEDEKALHKLFGSYNVQGEWFELTYERMFEVVVNYFFNERRIIPENERELPDKIEHFKRFISENWAAGRRPPLNPEMATDDGTLWAKYIEWSKRMFERPLSRDMFIELMERTRIGHRMIDRTLYWNMVLKQDSVVKHNYVKYGDNYEVTE